MYTVWKIKNYSIVKYLCMCPFTSIILCQCTCIFMQYVFGNICVHEMCNMLMQKYAVE